MPLLELLYNTAAPSSAAMERLFFLCKDIIRTKKISLSDENFNMGMITKGNMSMLKFETFLIKCSYFTENSILH